MKKKEIYELRSILQELLYIKQADTDEQATHDKFVNLQKRGIQICTRSINIMKPLKMEK